MTERLHFHFSLSCIGERNDNPLQCSCLENPRDGGAWWAAVYGAAQSRTRLKRLSSSSSIIASQVAQIVKNPPAMWETWVRSLGWEDPWRRKWQPTPGSLPGESLWREESGGLQFFGSQRVRCHGLSTAQHTHMTSRGRCSPPVLRDPASESTEGLRHTSHPIRNPQSS